MEKSVIKKDGILEGFNPEKILKAVGKSAERVMASLTKEDEDKLLKSVAEYVDAYDGNAVPVAEMHHMVEASLDKVNPQVAKSYREYRNYKQDFVHMLDEVYKKSLSVKYIGDRDNANTDSALVPTQRSLTYSDLNGRLYKKFFLNQEERAAMKEGYIYIHDRGARLDTMNCCLVDMPSVLNGGFEMGNVWYNEPKTLDVAFDVISDITMTMAACQYGGFTIPRVDTLLAPYAEKSYQKYRDEYLNMAENMSSSKTEEEIEKEIDSEREKNARNITVEGRAVENGDTAMIDYEGFVDGEAFEGGKGENHSLVIGSGSFIPGFEDQLIGKNAGDDVEVNVTFPEEYHAKDLAGKAAVFKVKINEIKTKEIPELDEEFVQDVSEFDTVDEYKNSIKEKIEERKANSAKAAQTDEAIKKIVDKSEMDIPEAMIDTQCEDMINQFAQQMAQQGLSMQQYLQFTGMTMDKMKEQVRDEALARIESSLVLEQIAKEENIEITDEDVDAEIEKMAELYKMEADQLKGYMGESEKEAMKKDLAEQRAVDLIMENVKYRAKPKSKKEKEAAEEGAAEEAAASEGSEAE